jgi:GNAT superfamily N-acetyltransferase
MNLKSGSIQSFERFSQFQSRAEFLDHIDMWLADCKREFSKGELVGFNQLVEFASDILGVSHVKIDIVLNVIHEEYHDHGISRATFKRMLGKAKRLGILRIYETERGNGSQASNLYVFNPFQMEKKAIHSKN